MTRIIAGYAGSLAIAVPPKGTRPTSDRVREAIFSALEARDALEGATVFDLYAGSGALGLEAASRGAVSVTLVEKNAAASAICRRNADLIRSKAPKGTRITVAPVSVQSFLAGAVGTVDLVFIDPPYELGEDALAADLAALPLAPGAIVLVERSSRSPEPRWPEGLKLDRSRKHGDTTLWWASAA
ncbi:16S rRNA (guanine(966)-N(2))-methyltransferase RsmD [Salinibacterium sp. dk2585]|uniref:16S rRNA (guanine(966)-N(2))-methyltransferase RsmD n=1 Tax=unclassified Salinibacterium TaxID=2632331 RepID=UPI0011C24A73|nr:MULTISPECIES: 16S rRNA (guanine(966)-N(2))-methyltransferase RsmD [unclassified Salinibacterium]QEE60954.1 16S rRNA (guanine(966)-N(2))-methyltransferase RsmD [Salinibacterium sp. dk2585]TXK56025.1 16S rRNA (guanine(966)-N(2))-methyltransferase RsmD [Salinibacterium sp. dk5596]